MKKRPVAVCEELTTEAMARITGGAFYLPLPTFIVTPILAMLQP